MRCRTVYRATCSSIYVIWALQLTSIFLDIDRIFFVDTCCVWGGFGRFQTYLGATTRCLLFAGTGGVFTQRANSPPVFASFCFLILFFHTITNARPRPPKPYIIVSRDRLSTGGTRSPTPVTDHRTKPYIIVSRDRLSTGGTFFVVNVRFFIDS